MLASQTSDVSDKSSRKKRSKASYQQAQCKESANHKAVSLSTIDDDDVGMLFKNINDNIKLFRNEFVQGNKRVAEDYIFKVLDQARNVEDRLLPLVLNN